MNEEKKEPVAKLHAAEKSMILRAPCQGQQADPSCRDENILEEVGESRQRQGTSKGRFCRAKSFGTGSTVNYVYFGLLFLLLSLLHAFSIGVVENSSGLHRTFYIIYAVGQCFLEVGALMLCSHFLVKRFPRSLNPLFIGLTFVLLIVHLVDFPLVHLMGFTIWFGLDMLSAESFENFIEMLYAANISLKTWMSAGAVLVGIFFLGMLIFKATNRISKKYPLQFSYSASALSMISGVLFLSLFDFKTYGLTEISDNAHLMKALPWKSTLFQTAYPTLGIGKGLRALPEEKELRNLLQSTPLVPKRTPNIFLFVVESLREDFIQPNIAPNICRFREDNLSFDLALSGANYTQASWFTIFHARHPFYWGKKPYRAGSLPLKLLKQAGYKTHVYTSSRLNFYHMGEVLFGKKQELLDSLADFSHDGTKESHESDAQCFAQLTRDMETFREETGHLFVLFLDATHFPYSWPKDEPALFTPFVERINYLKVACSQENIEEIKNRYRNTIFYLDQLFGKFSENLKAMTAGEDSVVVFTADHGEEFSEEGNIFHASDLTDMQTRIPLYYKFGTNSVPGRIKGITSHVDIFPSIMTHVFGEELPFATYFDGESIFKDSRRQFAVAARYNGNRSPYEFCIHNGSNKCVLRFLDKRNIFKSSLIEVVAHKHGKDSLVAGETHPVETEFKQALEHLFVTD